MSLFALGRRAEGRSVCEELAGAGRSGQLTTVLAEEGRFGEAAELDEAPARREALGVLEQLASASAGEARA
ncbi:hypothetical protein ACFZCK_37205 [Kitasatospora purpeofusca]|uniref:hypothetical protein n=1 Tax=Kitasatospora purpeofusca TaxID=67352 RepID=UPI0036E2B7D2